MGCRFNNTNFAIGAPKRNVFSVGTPVWNTLGVFVLRNGRQEIINVPNLYVGIFPAVAISAPSGFQSRHRISCECPLIAWNNCREDASRSGRCPPSTRPPDTVRRDSSRRLIRNSAAVYVAVLVPLTASQTTTSPLHPAVARLIPSGDHWTSCTPLLSASNSLMSSPFAAFQTTTPFQ